MARYVAFIRAINVGGRRISNDELRSHFETLGFGVVSVYQAAGNVVFEAEERRAEIVSRRVDDGLTERLGYECVTHLRTAEEVRSIAQAEPFDPEVTAGRKLHVALLQELPEATIAGQVLAAATEDDRLAFGTRELYWLPKGRMIDSGLDLRAVERLVGGWTMRTKGTIERIAARFFAV
jgi:uncharacterized protein (DUF1697 family)